MHIFSLILIKLISLTFLSKAIPFKNYKFEFNTAYSQFYIGDKGYKGNTESADFWTEQAHRERLAIAGDVLAVGTESYGHIKAELTVLEKPSGIKDFKKYDHVVEGDLTLKSDVLEVTDCPNNNIELKIRIKPGNYRVRIYSIDLAKADRDLFNGKDSYKIELWPSVISGKKVLKQYHQ